MTKAQLHPHDDLGWLVDRMADPDGDRRLCPKACARAKAALLREREMMRIAAARDRALTAEVDDLRADVERLLAAMETACENTPWRGCECPGCQTARERADEAC